MSSSLVHADLHPSWSIPSWLGLVDFRISAAFIIFPSLVYLSVGSLSFRISCVYNISLPCLFFSWQYNNNQQIWSYTWQLTHVEYWNGVCADQFGDQRAIRMGKGALRGTTLSPGGLSDFAVGCPGTSHCPMVLWDPMGHPTSPRSGICWSLLSIPSHSLTVTWDLIGCPTSPSPNPNPSPSPSPDQGLVGYSMGSQGTMEVWDMMDKRDQVCMPDLWLTGGTRDWWDVPWDPKALWDVPKSQWTFYSKAGQLWSLSILHNCVLIDVNSQHPQGKSESDSRKNGFE